MLAVAVCALLAGLVATQVGRHRPPSAAPSTAGSSAPSSPPTAFNEAQALDVAAGGGSMWVLEGAALARFYTDGAVASVRLRLRLPVPSTPLLAVDATRARVWIVVADAAPSRMIEFDTRDLRRIREVSWPQLVQGAVAYGGHLYLATDTGVADLAPGARAPHVVPGLSGAVGQIAVDPTRHRLIAIDLGFPTTVWTYRPGGRPAEATTRLEFQEGSLAVVDGRVWVGGFAARGAVLQRLDPTTFRPVAGGPAPEFDPGARIVAGGSDVVWVRAGGGSDLLACVDAATGRVEQRWQLPGGYPMASRPRTALVATPQGVLNLLLTRCAG